jgi:predicted dehydrogenase
MTRLNANRRQFSAAALASMASIAIGGTKSSAKVLGANEKVRVALAGLNGRGAAHLEEYLRMKNVEIAWLVDPDSRTWTRRITLVAKSQANPPKTTKDVRKALEDKNVDVVSIATPNHWHSLMTMWACQAGKDVYVEKPCSTAAMA